MLCQSLCSRELCLLSFWRRGWAPSSLILSCPAVVEALGVLEPQGSPVPWRDGSLSDLSLTGEEPAPGGSPGDSGSALSAQSTEVLEGLSGRVPKAGGRQEEAGTPRRGLGARLQQLLTPSRRPPASRIPPPELPPDVPPPARRSPMDSLLRPRERPGSTASEVASQGRSRRFSTRRPRVGGLRTQRAREGQGAVEASILVDRGTELADHAFSRNGRAQPLWAASGTSQSPPSAA